MALSRDRGSHLISSLLPILLSLTKSYRATVEAHFSQAQLRRCVGNGIAFRDAVSDYVQDYASDPEDDEGFEGLEGFEEQGSLQELEESSSEILGDAPLFEDHVPDLLSINLESSLEATIAKRKAAFQARLTPQKYRARRQRPQNGHSLNPASPLPPVYSPLRRSGNRKDHSGNDTSDNNLFVHGSAQPNGPDKPPSWIVHKCAQLEAQIRKLRRENQEWVNRFRSEARTRATVYEPEADCADAPTPTG